MIPHSYSILMLISHQRTNEAKLRRSYAIANIAQVSNAVETKHKLHVSNDEYKPERQPEAESQGHGSAVDDFYDDELTPKKKQKTIKVPVREAINANCKEHESHKAENKVNHFIV